MAVKIEHIRIDPSALAGFDTEYCQDVVNGEEGGSDFAHDPDFVDKICESIRLHRLALVTLPPRYAKVYQHLLNPRAYPQTVKDMTISAEVKKNKIMLEKDVLSKDLLNVLEGWATVCEHCTRHVAQRLRRLNLSRENDPFRYHESHGQLRIAINCDTEPHNDNSYVTILGTGNMKGTLKLQIGERWIDCEDFIEEVSASKPDGPTFLMFAGSLGCQLDGEYKPLNHNVKFDFDPNELHGRERVNATYFVRRYAEGHPEATRDITSTELQFQHWNRIIMQSEFLHRPPRPPRAAAAPAAAGGGAEENFDEEEEFMTNDFLDWNSAGLPLNGAKRESPGCWAGLWRVFSAPFLKLL